MQEIVKDDMDRFCTAMIKATKVFHGGDPRTAKFEPVTVVAIRHRTELTLVDVACELGIPDPKDLLAAIKFNDHLRNGGLGSLQTPNGQLPRDIWEVIHATSLFQLTARILELGTPQRPVD
jgi:hypothetical protein